MKKAIVFASIFTALTGASAFAENGDYSECGAANRPITVLNAETGRYESVRARTDRGWCQWSDGTIGDGSWEADGGSEASSSEGSESSSGGEGSPY
jgi:hypothetical protein